MKVLLVNPPRYDEIRCPTPEVLEKNRGSNPPLGILFIAAVLEEAGHEVRVIDTQVEGYTYDEVETLMREAEYDLLGLTVMTFSLVDSLRVSRISKDFHPDAPIVWGGPHAHIFDQESVEFPVVDYVVKGEGENAIMDLVGFLQGEIPWEQVMGVGRNVDGKYDFNGPALAVENLDELPFVARHLTPIEKYGSILAKGKTVTTIFTSRGCPYKCAFCDRPQLRPNFRPRSAMNVVDEIEHCYKMGIDEFILYDDTFTVDKKRCHDICDEIIRRKMKVFWDCRTNVNAVDRELINHMAEAGCVGIHYGVEAGTPKIQKVINKNLKLDKVDRVFTMTREAGIKSMAYFIIGNPTETREDIAQGFQFLKQIDPDLVHITCLLPFPATQIYLTGLANGVIKYDYWKEFAKNPNTEFVTPHWPEIFTRDEMDQLIINGYRGFYLRPKYLLRRIGQIRSFRELVRNVRFGIGLLWMKMRRSVIDPARYFDFSNSSSGSEPKQRLLRI